MSANPLLEYYESLVRFIGEPPEEQNPHLREYVTEIRDAWENRVIVRDLRYRAGMPVCSGEVDCLEDPTTHCMDGDHPTCTAHTDHCYLCIPMGEEKLRAQFEA